MQFLSKLVPQFKHTFSLEGELATSTAEASCRFYKRGKRRMRAHQVFEMSTPKSRAVRPPMLSLPETPPCIASASQGPLHVRGGRIQEESSSGLVYGVAARRGRRQATREDMYFTLPFAVRDEEGKPISIFGVLDGHGGHGASKFASDRLPQLLLDDTARLSPTCVSAALHHAFMQTDAEFVAGGGRTSSSRTSVLGKKTKSGSVFATIALVADAVGQ
jgi:hypothetical protein